MRPAFPTLAAIALLTSAALAGGGNVTSTEPGPPVLSETTTDQMLDTMGVAAPAITPVIYVAPSRNTPAEQATASVEEAPAEAIAAASEPLEPRKVIRQCSTCHGKDGIALIPTAPNIAGSSRVYLESQMKAFRSGKRENEVMTVIAEGLSDEEITAAAQWYSSINVTTVIPE